MDSPIVLFFNNLYQSSSSPGVTRRLMMGTGMPETGGIEMEEKTTSFCVVCTDGTDVYFQAYWEKTHSERIGHIATTVAATAERFGHNEFNVVITEISD